MKDGIYTNISNEQYNEIDVVNIKKSVKEIPFADRYKYLNGSEIGAIIKYYKGYDFATYTTFNFIHSVKKWSLEQLAKFSEKNQEKNDVLFQIGKDFENQMAAEFNDIGNIQDFSSSDTSFANDDLRISATPDFLMTTKNGSITLIETKAGGVHSEYLTSYKYQVAIQSLLLPQFDIDAKNTQIMIFFGSDLKKAKNDNIQYKPYICDKQEIKKMQKEIVECAKQFWIDNENNNFSFVEFDEAMSVFNAKDVFVETDSKVIDIFERLNDIKDQIKLLQEQSEEISNAFLDKYIKYDKVQFGECEKKMSIVKSKPIKIDTIQVQGDINKTERKLVELKQLKEEVSKGEIFKDGRKSYIMIK
jgi:hypothetical protein